MERPVISVVMSIYNEQEEWMLHAIDSILNQTFADFEFIIINDKPDRIENSLLLKKYAQIDARIVTIENEENIGLTKSLNKGLSLAKGKYIARMDADDISSLDRFEKQVDFLEIHSDVGILGSSACIIDERGKVTNQIKQNLGSELIKVLLFFGNCMMHPSVMLRRQVVPEQFYYDENYVYAQDYELWARVSHSVRLYITEDSLIQYRVSANQISTNKKGTQDQYAKQIREDQLIRLLKPSDQELLLHQLLFQDSMISSGQFDDLYHWLIKLNTKNKHVKVFCINIFERFICVRVILSFRRVHNKFTASLTLFASPFILILVKFGFLTILKKLKRCSIVNDWT